jgi:hypothetical protein
MRVTLMLAAAAASFATACASTATPYQLAGKNGFGFTETQIEDNRTRLSFSGNSSTELTTVKKYVLFRAAELTLQRGYDYFFIVDRGVDTTQEYRVSGPVRPRLGGGTLEQSDASYQQIADVTMFKGQKPAIFPNAYDAREVKDNLEPSIQRPTKA